MKLALDAWQEISPGTIHTIPVRLDDCDVPEPFRRYHYANLFDPQGFERLKRALLTGLAQLKNFTPQVGLEPPLIPPSDAEPKPSKGDKARWIWEYKLTVRGFALIIVIASLLLIYPILVHVVSEIRVKTRIEELSEIRVKTRIEELFDPQQTPEGDYKYRYKTPNGYDKQVDTNGLFQEFATNYLVLRLWSDPQSLNSFIRAHRMPRTKDSDNKNELRVSFIRDSQWGCDITIKQQFNKTTKVTDFHRLVLKMRAKQTDIDNLKAAKEGVGLDFRLRLVDGRGNHWVWGKSNRKLDDPTITYSFKDSKGTELRLSNGEVKDFHFDIASRDKWAEFDSDGSMAPIDSKSKRFNFVQAVVIEPAIAVKDTIARISQEENNEPSENKHRYERLLYDSTYEGIFYIREILFSRDYE
jgi:hypothetical protein